CGKVFNWETAKYGKIWYDEDVYDLRSIKTEFPAIVFDDAFTSEVTLSCEPTVSPLNDNEIDFRISFDESDDEECTIIYEKNSFSYKIISVNDLKTDSENDNEKVNLPSFPSPEPTVSYFLTEPIVSPQHIDEFNLKDETSFSKCDEVEQNGLYFNDLFPFNIIYLDDSKPDKDNDDDKIDIKHSSRGIVINIDDGAYAHGSNKLLETSLPIIGMNITSIKSISKFFGKTLEIGRLDFDSQIPLPVKCLVLTSSMNEVCQNVSVTLNRKSYPIKISEERFNASSLISSPHPYPGENVMFEEEFVEPSMVVCEDVNSPGCLRLRKKEDKKVMSALSPFPIYEAANSCSFRNEKGLNDEIIPESMHANFGSSLIMNVGPSFL
ncbi:hypothetical protein Tco_0842832, partial [Tanacetum coccineum]